MDRSVPATVTPRLIDTLYCEALVLADEARTLVERETRRGTPSAAEAIAWSCESLKLTSRVMHAIAWLLARKAIAAGERMTDADDKPRIDTRLIESAAPDPMLLAHLSTEAREVIAASEDLMRRLRRLARRIDAPADAGIGARGLIAMVTARC